MPDLSPDELAEGRKHARIYGGPFDGELFAAGYALGARHGASAQPTPDPTNTEETPLDALRRFAREADHLHRGLTDRGIVGPVGKQAETALAAIDELHAQSATLAGLPIGDWIAQMARVNGLAAAARLAEHVDAPTVRDAEQVLIGTAERLADWALTGDYQWLPDDPAPEPADRVRIENFGPGEPCTCPKGMGYTLHVHSAPWGCNTDGCPCRWYPAETTDLTAIAVRAQVAKDIADELEHAAAGEDENAADTGVSAEARNIARWSSASYSNAARMARRHIHEPKEATDAA